MNIFELIAIILFIVSFLLFLIFLMYEYRFFHVTFKSKLIKPSFEQTCQIPNIISFFQLATGFIGFTIGGLYMVFNSDNPIRNHIYEFSKILWLGLVLGIYVGRKYYHKVRVPFYEENYPEDYEYYKKTHVSGRSDRFLERSFEEIFFWSFSVLAMLIGNIVVRIL